jgi:hypothetical protein
MMVIISVSTYYDHGTISSYIDKDTWIVLLVRITIGAEYQYEGQGARRQLSARSWRPGGAGRSKWSGTIQGLGPTYAAHCTLAPAVQRQAGWSAVGLEATKRATCPNAEPGAGGVGVCTNYGAICRLVSRRYSATVSGPLKSLIAETEIPRWQITGPFKNEDILNLPITQRCL